MNALPFAAGASSEVSDALVALFVLLAAAKIGEEICRRIGQPVVIGEILAGVAVGPYALGLVELSSAVEVFAELGVIFLLFWVGLETRLADIRAVGRSATQVGVFGVVLPVFAGIVAALAFGEPIETALFLGAALAATSVGITSAILLELKLQDGRAGRTILGAAVIDDVLALLILAVAIGVASDGGLDWVDLGLLVVLSAGFLALFGLGGSKLLQSKPELLEKPQFASTPLLPAVLLCLGLAVLAQEIGLAAVIGAFLAGMIVAETREHNSIEREIEPLYKFFAPFFFAVIGAQVDIGEFTDLKVDALLVGLTALAIVTKYAGAWLGASALNRDERSIVALGMVPRGEVGVIVAGLGYTQGVIAADLFAVVVGMSILTTFLAPYLIRRSARRSGLASGP